MYKRYNFKNSEALKISKRNAYGSFYQIEFTGDLDKKAVITKFKNEKTWRAAFWLYGDSQNLNFKEENIPTLEDAKEMAARFVLSHEEYWKIMK